MTREEYIKLRDYIGTAKANAICELKLGYDSRSQLLAAKALVPEGYAVVQLPHP